MFSASPLKEKVVMASIALLVIAVASLASTLFSTLMLRGDRKAHYGDKLAFSSSLESAMDYYRIDPETLSPRGRIYLRVFWVSQVILAVEAFGFMVLVLTGS
jgi:hypothetical protein